MEARERCGRPLTRVLVYLVLALVISLAVGVVAAALLGLERYAGAPTLTPLDLLATSFLLAPLQLLLTHLFLRHVDRRSWQEIFAGWPRLRVDDGPFPARSSSRSAARGRQFACGWGLAAGILGLVLVACALAGWMRLGGWGTAAGAGYLPAAGTAVAALLATFLQGGTEEVIFRGYVMHNLARWRGLPAAVTGSALIFGLIHGVNPDAGPVALANVALIGVFLGLLRARFTLWTAIGLHSGWNSLLVLLSLPCSGYHIDGLLVIKVAGPALWTGGGFGVEASLLVTILFAVGIGILLLSRSGGPGHPAGTPAPCDSEPDLPPTT